MIWSVSVVSRYTSANGTKIWRCDYAILSSPHAIMAPSSSYLNHDGDEENDDLCDDHHFKKGPGQRLRQKTKKKLHGGGPSPPVLHLPSPSPAAFYDEDEGYQWEGSCSWDSPSHQDGRDARACALVLEDRTRDREARVTRANAVRALQDDLDRMRKTSSLASLCMRVVSARPKLMALLVEADLCLILPLPLPLPL